MPVESTTREFTAPDGVRLRADCRGDPKGPPVVFSHGGGQTRHAWGRAAEALAGRGWHAICYDHRGHGDSDWDPSGVYRFESFCHDLGAVVLDEAGIEGIQAFMESNAAEGFASLEEAADAVAGYTGRPRRQDISGLKKNLRRCDGRWYWHWDPKLLTLHEADIGEREARFERAVANLAIPLMLVRGSASEVVTEEEARAFLELAPHAEYVDVQQARHMVAGDRNDVFTAAVQDFLEKITGG